MKYHPKLRNRIDTTILVIIATAIVNARYYRETTTPYLTGILTKNSEAETKAEYTEVDMPAICGGSID